MAELLTVTEIKEKLTKYVPQNCFNSLLTYYSEIIEYASNIDNANWNVSNRDNLRFFQLNCGNKYIIRNQEDSLLVMCWRDEFLNLDNEFINKFLEECKFYKEESTIEKIGGFVPKTKEDLSKIEKEALWQNTFQFLVPYTKLDEYKAFILPSIKAFAKYAIQTSKIMHNMEIAYQKDFVSLINETLGKDIKQPTYCKQQWVISGNPDIYDTVSAFNELEEIDWKQPETAKIDIGDIVYIYVSHDVHALKIKAEVIKINLKKEETIDDSRFVLNKEELGTAKFYMRLKKGKLLEGSAFEKSKLELFGFKVPQGPVKVLEETGKYLDLIEKLQSSPEIEPDKYDASYEFVTEVVKSYSKLEDISVCNFRDLNLIYLSTVGTWKHSVEKKKESIQNSNLPDSEKQHLIQFLSDLWEKVKQGKYSHFEEEGKVSFGMFGTGFYNTETKTDNDSVQKLIKMFSTILSSDSEEELFSIVSDSLKDGIKGLAAGGVSVILHCLKPFVFPIMNSHQGDNSVYEKLGIEIIKSNSEKTYIENARRIQEYRNSNFKWRNYRILDLLEIEKHENHIDEGEKMDKINECKKLLENTHNLILHGAPGTGKTHLAKQIAKEMGCSDDEIGFVQFHPSYDYTDFVEGLRPVKDENDEVVFERMDGVFKKFCKNALTTNQNFNTTSFDICWENLISLVKNNLSEKKLTKIGSWEYGLSTKESLKYSSEDSPSKYNFTITKQNVFDAYRGIKARPKGGFQKEMEQVVQYLKDNFSLEDYVEKEKKSSSSEKYIFIIDEINRGELSKIFGELFFSIDPGYRGEKGRINTQYQNLIEDDLFKDGFYIPENVYIIGTMNDIDRSVESMDFAFRRRFTFKEITAKDTQEAILSELGDETRKEAIKRMDSLNYRIWHKPEENESYENRSIEGLSSAYHIGGAYFLKLKYLENSFENLWEYHLSGLLREYLRGMEDAEDSLEKLHKAYNLENQEK